MKAEIEAADGGQVRCRVRARYVPDPQCAARPPKPTSSSVCPRAPGSPCSSSSTAAPFRPAISRSAVVCITCHWPRGTTRSGRPYRAFRRAAATPTCRGSRQCLSMRRAPDAAPRRRHGPLTHLCRSGLADQLMRLGSVPDDRTPDRRNGLPRLCHDNRTSTLVRHVDGYDIRSVASGSPSHWTDLSSDLPGWAHRVCLLPVASGLEPRGEIATEQLFQPLDVLDDFGLEGAAQLRW